jgi:hypothetical protein
MFRKFVLLMFLVTFVGTASFAEDLNPPPWAGAPGSVYVLEEFNEDSPAFSFNAWANIPEDQLMVPHPEGYWINPDRSEWLWEDFENVREHYGEYESPVWSNQGWKTNRAEWHEEYEGRHGVFQTPGFGVEIANFEGEGTKHIWIQMVKTGDPHEGAEVEGEPDSEGEFFFQEMEFELINEIDLGNGWFHYTYFLELEFNPAWEAMTLFTGDENLAYIDQYVIDTICFLGDEPPEGPGRAIQVSALSPSYAENGIKHDVDTQLCFQAPRQAACIAEPNLVGPHAKDPNDFLQGPFEYTVLWGGDNPSKAEMAVLDVCSPAECNAVMCFDPCSGELTPGTTYYWAVDINDLNETDIRPGGNPSFYEGPVFRFTTWGFATLISPENGAEGVDAGTVDLLFNGDGYQSSFVVHLLDEGENELANSGSLSADANSWTPLISLGLSQTYKWYVEECNTPGCVASETSTFSTDICKTVDDFESYADSAAIKAVWQAYPDYNPGADNCVATELNTSAEYVYEPGPGSNKSMMMNAERYYLEGGNDEIQRTFTEANGRNFKFDGGRSLWIAYRTEETDPVLAADDIYMQLEDKDAGASPKIYYTGDSNTLEWDIFYVSVVEAYDSGDGADPNTIKKIRIGIEGAKGEEAEFSKGYFDLLTRCAPICRTEEGLHPAYDFTGPEGPDCVVDGWDLAVVTDNWLETDEYLYPEEPCEANLVLELKFDSDLTDTSTNGYTVVAGGSSPPVVADGECTFDGDGWLTVEDMNSLELFAGDKSFTIAIDYQTPDRFMLFSSARDPYDGSAPGYEYPETHSLHVFEGPCNMFQDNFYIGGTSMGGFECIGDIPLTLVTSYDAVSKDHTIYRMDEDQPYALQGDTGNWDPNIPDADLDTIMIGSTRNSWFRDDEGTPNFEGTMDNIRVYDKALTPEEVLWLKYYSEEVQVPVDEQANIVVDGAFGENIINFPDYTEFATLWMNEKLWPVSEF